MDFQEFIDQIVFIVQYTYVCIISEIFKIRTEEFENCFFFFTVSFFNSSCLPAVQKIYFKQICTFTQTFFVITYVNHSYSRSEVSQCVKHVENSIFLIIYIWLGIIINE